MEAIKKKIAQDREERPILRQQLADSIYDDAVNDSIYRGGFSKRSFILPVHTSMTTTLVS